MKQEVCAQFKKEKYSKIKFKIQSRMVVIALGLQVGLVWADFKPKYGPKEAPRAVPLAQSYEYFNNSKRPQADFWALISYYVPQKDEYSCSAATLAMVLNAARARLYKTASDPVMTQEMLLDTVRVENWKQRLSPESDPGSRGVTLDQFAQVITQAFKMYGFPKVQVTQVHVQHASAERMQELLKILKSKSDKEFLVANFDQGILTEGQSKGYFAPVAAFDCDRMRVLILDPNRSLYEPYWVSLGTFLKAMATADPDVKAARGYLLIKP